MFVVIVGGVLLVVFPPAPVTKGFSGWYADDSAPKSSDDWSYGGWGYDNVDSQVPAESGMNPREKAIMGRLQEVERRLDAHDATNTAQTSQLTVLESKNAGVESQLKEVRETMDEVKEQPKKERREWEALFGTLLTRFGIAAVVLLLMRFMSSIYRYHARMAAFYDAKADVFEACGGGDVHAMEKLSHLLTPSGVDFHETADTLMEHAVDLAKKATAS